MRQIEKRMIKAIIDRKSWQSGNTAVIMDGGVADVYLHGHHIAEARRNYYGSVIITPNKLTLSRWPTVTTKSRLRALGVDVCTRKGVVLLNGKPLEV
jgi:hypothetical protein